MRLWMSFFKSRCYNGGKKHNFYPVYNETRTPPGKLKGHNLDAEEMGFLINKFSSYVKTYVKSVCRWCGVAAKEGK